MDSSIKLELAKNIPEITRILEPSLDPKSVLDRLVWGLRMCPHVTSVADRFNVAPGTVCLSLLFFIDCCSLEWAEDYSILLVQEKRQPFTESSCLLVHMGHTSSFRVPEDTGVFGDQMDSFDPSSMCSIIWDCLLLVVLPKKFKSLIIHAIYSVKDTLNHVACWGEVHL